MNHADAIAWTVNGVLLAALGVALYTDLLYGRVYNWCTLPAIGLGLLINYVAGAWEPAQGNVLAGVLGGPLLASLAGLALAVGIFGVAYLLGMLGGGDVKLMCAVGALKGWRFFLDAAVLTACVGAVMAVAVLAGRGRLWAGLKGSVSALFAPRKFRRRIEAAAAEDAPEMITIPYVVAIVVGTLVAWVLTSAQ